MNSFYAQLNENNIVVGISQLSGKVEQDDLINITQLDPDLLGKLYDHETETFIDNPAPPDEPETIIPSEVNLEYIKHNQLIQMEGLASIYEELNTNMLILFNAIADINESLEGR